MIYLKLLAALFFFLIPVQFSFSQQRIIDSLEKRLAIPEPDSVRVNDLNELCWLYITVDINKAKEYCYKAELLAEQIRYKTGIAKALILLSNIFYEQGNYEKSLEYNLRSLKIREETGDRWGVASALDNIGVMYTLMGSPEKALEYHLKSLAVFRDLYLQKPEDKFKYSIAGTMINIGYVLYEMQSYDSALVYDFGALKILDEIGHKPTIASCLNNIGTVYVELGNNILALEYLLKSLNMYEETGNVQGTSALLVNIGNIYRMKGNYQLAIDYCNRGLKIATTNGLRDDIQFGWLVLARVYAGMDDFKTAYHYFQLYSEIKDSLMNVENQQNIARLQTIYEAEKKDKELAKKDAEISRQEAAIRVKEAEGTRQKIFILSVLLILILVIIFSVVLFNRFRIIRKQKNIIQMQKQLVDEKNQNILDSIEYASRIQHALLTSEDYINQYLKDYFILYFPKDIISGDYYWTVEKDGQFFMATADCTGHGVPGTLMSVLGISFLNEIIIERNITSPDAILNALRHDLIHRLNPAYAEVLTGTAGGKEDIADGMDIVICKFDFSKDVLEYAGANMGILVKRNMELIELPGDDMPVGAGHRKMESFSLHRFILRKGDALYTFSDGIRDQFGGAKGKKMGRKGLQRLLLQAAHPTMEGEKEFFKEEFHKWKGSNEQTDDVLVIGVRV